MGRLQQIGTAIVKLVVDKTGLDRGLKEAQVQTQRTVSEINSQTAQAGTSGLGGVGRGINEATKGTRVFIGSLTAAVGIITRMLGLIGLVTGAVAGLAAAWKHVAQAGERAAEVQQKRIDGQRNLANQIDNIGRRFERSSTPEIAATQEYAENLRELNRLREAGLTAAKEQYDADAAAVEVNKLRVKLQRDSYLPTGAGQDAKNADQERLAKLERDLELYAATLTKLQAESVEALAAIARGFNQASIDRLARNIDGLRSELQQFNRAVSTKRIEQQISLLINRP